VDGGAEPVPPPSPIPEPEPLVDPKPTLIVPAELNTDAVCVEGGVLFAPMPALDGEVGSSPGIPFVVPLGIILPPTAEVKRNNPGSGCVAEGLRWVCVENKSNVSVAPDDTMS